MDNRTGKILEIAIREYIKTGQPVSSRSLSERYDFGVKAATIRNELNQLTKAGYLKQPHTSGGRVPTDRGYEHYIRASEDRSNLTPNIRPSQDLRLEMFDLVKGVTRDFHDFIDDFSKCMRLLGVGYQYQEDEVYGSGFDELVRQVEAETRKEFYELARDFEELKERLATKRKALVGITQEGPRVFIGKKSPITKSPHVSVIVDSVTVGDDPWLLIAIGPKRMDYNEKLGFFRMLKEKTEE